MPTPLEKACLVALTCGTSIFIGPSPGAGAEAIDSPAIVAADTAAGIFLASSRACAAVAAPVVPREATVATGPAWLGTAYAFFALPAIGYLQPAAQWVDIYTPLYDPDRRIALSGPALKICRIEWEDDRTALLVRITDTGKLFCVFLAPEDFLERNGIRLMVGDYIDVAGTPAYLDDHCCLIADRIRTSIAYLKLRDAAGRPLWDRAE